MSMYYDVASLVTLHILRSLLSSQKLLVKLFCIRSTTQVLNRYSFINKICVFFPKTEVADYELRTSNMAYVSNLLSVLSDYDKILKEKYLSTSKMVDFAKSDEVRQEINEAVEKETNSRIKDLIPAGIKPSSSSLLLFHCWTDLSQTISFVSLEPLGFVFRMNILYSEFYHTTLWMGYHCFGLYLISMSAFFFYLLSVFLYTCVTL